MAFLAQHLDAGASSAQIAALVGRVCREIDLALVPIVGQRGVAAMFARSLQLSAKSQPWLMLDASGASVVPVAFDPAVLCALIAQQVPPRRRPAPACCCKLFVSCWPSWWGVRSPNACFAPPGLLF